jgi:hypothetical protein
VSEIKKTDVGYTKDLKRCGNCRALSSQLLLPDWMAKENAKTAAEFGKCAYPIGRYGVEKNIRCSIHGFAVQRTAVCNFWTPATPPKDQS